MIWTIILGLSFTSGNKGISYILKAAEVCPLQGLHQLNCLGKTLISLIDAIVSVSSRKRFFPGASTLSDDTQRAAASPLALLMHPVFPWGNVICKTSFLEQGKIVVLNVISDGWQSCFLSLTMPSVMILKYIDGSTVWFLKCCAYPPVFCRLLSGDLSATGGNKGPTKDSWPLCLHTMVCLVVTFLFNRTKSIQEIRSQNSVGGKRPQEVCNPLLLRKA